VLIETDGDLAIGEFGIATRVTQPGEQPAPAVVGLPDPVAVPTVASAAVVPPVEAPAETVIYRPEPEPPEPEPEPVPQAPPEVVTLTVGGRVIPVSSDLVVVGRSRECDVRVDDGNVSRRHFELGRTEDSGWAVVDLGSTNGTEVNGRRITKRTSLDDGDRIGIGGAELVFGRSLT
jgi:FHA domain